MMLRGLPLCSIETQSQSNNLSASTVARSRPCQHLSFCRYVFGTPKQGLTGVIPVDFTGYHSHSLPAVFQPADAIGLSSVMLHLGPLLQHLIDGA